MHSSYGITLYTYHSSVPYHFILLDIDLLSETLLRFSKYSHSIIHSFINYFDLLFIYLSLSLALATYIIVILVVTHTYIQANPVLLDKFTLINNSSIMNHIHLQNSIPSFSSQTAPSTMMGLYPPASSTASVSLPQGNYFHQQQPQQQQQPFNTTSLNILNFPFLNCKSFLNYPINGTSISNNNNTNGNVNNNNNNNSPLLMSAQNDQDSWNRAMATTSTAANVSSAALAMIMMQQSNNMQQQQQQQQYQSQQPQYQTMFPQGMDASKLSLLQNLMQSNKSNIVTPSTTSNQKIIYPTSLPSYLTQQQFATPPLGVSIPESLSTTATTMDEKKKKRYRLNSDELNNNQQHGNEQSKKAKTTAKIVKNTEVLDRLKTVCERCTSLKAKCIKNEETGTCQRCAKWGHPCVFLHQRKRGPMSSSSKKEQLKSKQTTSATASSSSPRSPSLSSVSASPNPDFLQCNTKIESPAPDAEKISNVVS